MEFLLKYDAPSSLTYDVTMVTYIPRVAISQAKIPKDHLPQNKKRKRLPAFSFTQCTVTYTSLACVWSLSIIASGDIHFTGNIPYRTKYINQLVLFFLFTVLNLLAVCVGSTPRISRPLPSQNQRFLKSRLQTPERCGQPNRNGVSINTSRTRRMDGQMDRWTDKKTDELTDCRSDTLPSCRQDIPYHWHNPVQTGISFSPSFRCSPCFEFRVSNWTVHRTRRFSTSVGRI